MDKDRVPEGISASDWQDIRAAHEAWKHAIEPVKGGWKAHNASQQWTTQFDGRGFEAKPQNADWIWGLELRSYGAGDEQREVKGTPEVKTEGHRLAYHWDETVQEWFVNDGRGLEHGFSVQERPPGPSDAPLTFVLATRGPLRAAVTGDARAVDYRDQSGETVLTYSGLRVWDAEGRELDARFAPAQDGVTLQVDAKDARYPLLIDPVAEQAKLTSTAVAPLVFGQAVAISGDTVVVGDPLEANGKGAAYVFVRNGTAWAQQGVLVASNAGNGDGFGSPLAISGDTIVVGATFEASSGTGINGNGGSDNSASGAGAAYIFVRNGTTWTQQAYLKASNTGAGDQFGRAVAISGNTVVVGAPFEDNTEKGVNPDSQNRDTPQFDSGAAYVFARSGTTWTQRAYLKASNAGEKDNFGESVALSSIRSTVFDTVFLAVGAPGESSSAVGVDGDQNNNNVPKSGAVYVFRGSSSILSPSVGSFVQETYLKASNTGEDDRFGASLAVDGRSDRIGGSSLALVVGAPNEGNVQNNIAAPGSGAAYLFGRTQQQFPQAGPATWRQEAYLKASNAQGGDRFGEAVALANVGDTVVIGAPGEDSNATGINGNQLNNGANDSGAAYFFAPDPVTGQFSQRAYIKSSQGDQLQFGADVAMSGSTAIVGSLGGGATIIAGLEPIPFITSSATASGVTGTPFNYQITTTSVADTYAATGLPAGLTINPSTGAITGPPTAAGTFNVGLFAINTAGTDTATLTLTVTAAPPPPPRITSPLAAAGEVDAPFSYQITTAGGAPDSFGATGLPVGLSLNQTTGLISGTPQRAATLPITISASNAGGTDTKTLSLKVTDPPALVINSPTTAEGQIGEFFAYQISTSGGLADTFIASGLPPGLSIDDTSGLIEGIPAQEGVFSVILSATGVRGTDTKTLTLEIAADVASLKFLPPSRTVTAGKKARFTLLVANNLTRTQNVRVVFFYLNGVSGLVEPSPITVAAPGKKKANQGPKLSRVRVEIPIPAAAAAGRVGLSARVGDQTASSQLTIKVAQ